MGWVQRGLWSFSRFLAGGRPSARVALTLPVPFPPAELPERLAASEFAGSVALEGAAMQVGSARFELDWRRPEPDFAARFAAGACPIEPTVGEAEIRAAGRHVALLGLHGPRALGEEAALLAASLALVAGAAAVACGATGVLCEGSGLAHAPGRWRTLADAVRGLRAAELEDAPTLHHRLVEALVRVPLATDGLWRSRGAHLLGRPEVAVRVEDVAGLAEAALLLRGLAAYQCGSHLVEGQGFRLAEDAPRFTLHRMDPLEPPSSPTHDPWGAWLLRRDQGTG